MNLPEINIADLHEKIKETLIEGFPDCTVDFSPGAGSHVLTPSIVFGLESANASKPAHIGTEQLQVELKFWAVVADRERTYLGVRILALNVATVVDGNRWGQPVSPGMFIEALPQEGSGGSENANELWRIEWSHTAFLGKNIWEEEGTVPKKMMVSMVPKIGIPHKSEYREFSNML